MAGISERSARLELRRTGDRTRVEVFAPGDLALAELEIINRELVEKIIKRLTGCACLSGAIDVIFRPEFEEVIRVDLSAPRRG